MRSARRPVGFNSSNAVGVFSSQARFGNDVGREVAKSMRLHAAIDRPGNVESARLLRAGNTGRRARSGCSRRGQPALNTRVAVGRCGRVGTKAPLDAVGRIELIGIVDGPATMIIRSSAVSRAQGRARRCAG